MFVKSILNIMHNKQGNKYKNKVVNKFEFKINLLLLIEIDLK